MRLILSVLATLIMPVLSWAQIAMPQDNVGKISYFTCPADGDMRFPVIFVSFQDKGFADELENVKAHFERKYNLEGFS